MIPQLTGTPIQSMRFLNRKKSASRVCSLSTLWKRSGTCSPGRSLSAEQFSYPAHESDSQWDIEGYSSEAEEHGPHVAPVPEERVREKRVENDLIDNRRPDELADCLKLFPDSR